MGDTINNMEDFYKKWETRSASSFSSYRSRGHRPLYRHGGGRGKPNYIVRNDQRERSDFARRNRGNSRASTVKLHKFHGLAQFKMAPTILPLNKPRPFMGLCCPKCLPQSRAALPYSYIPSLPLCNVLLLPFAHRSVPYIPSSLLPMFYIFGRSTKFKYPDVSEQTLQSKRVCAAINNEAEYKIQKESSNCTNSENSIEYHHNIEKLRAKNILQVMKSSVYPFLFRIAGWLMYKILGWIFCSIQIHKGQIETLKTASQEDIPIIYVPMHRSHLDYVLLSLILYMHDLTIPLVAAGENLLIPLFAFTMRHLGAFFIRRRIDIQSDHKDIVYRAVLQSYVVECLKTGHSLEIFIEGGRSRNGKSRIPKAGLLSVIVDSILEGDVEDAYIVPVAISYEKLVEGNFISEQLGKRKRSESFLSTVYSIWKILHSDCSNVRIDFCQPFLLKEFLQSSGLPSTALSTGVETPPSSPCSPSSDSDSLFSSQPASKSLRTVIRNLAEHVVYDTVFSSALMSTQLTAFLFLTKHRKGATQQQLLYSFDWLRNELFKRKRDVGFTGSSGNIIKHAVTLLGNELITSEVMDLEWTSSDMENNNIKILFYKPVVKLPHVLELQYYSNAAVPVFALDSIVVNALYAILDDDICHFQMCESKLQVSKRELVDKSVELCQLLRFEFQCIPPCADASVSMNDVIEDLIAKECLHITGAMKYASGHGQKLMTQKSHHYSFEPSDEDDNDNEEAFVPQQQLKVDLSEESIDHLEFLRVILSPFIESYWLAACTLFKLISYVMEEQQFLKEIQNTAQDRLHKGLLCYEESFGLESLKNAMKLFEYWRVLEHYYEEGMKIIYLSEEYDSEEKINDIISRIEEFRK